jgi:glycosyltransferase involved in cell wall biosynthesis
MSDRLLAAIPAYNEAARIGPVIARTKPQVSEVVVVDDGSTDETGNVARREGAVVLRHEANLGKGAAILSALNYFHAGDAEFAVFLDADGQHDPAEIPSLLAVARQTGAGIVAGTRMGQTKNMPVVRLLANRLTSWVISLLAHQRIPDSQCGYRLVRRTILPDLRLSTRHFETESEMLIQAGRAGHRIVSAPIRTIYEPGRHSRIRPGRDTVRFCRMLWRYR